MLQQVMTSPGKIEFFEVPIPEPGPGEVLIKMMKIGICGSDIHVYHGKHPFTSYPITQGHEVSGEIVKLGPGVQDRCIGQKVTVQPQVTCGKCYPCRNGKYNLCESLKVMGFQTTGMASTYFSVDAGLTLPLPSEMSFDQGAMIEPVAVAVHAVRRFGSVEGKNVVVFGAGPIGNLVAQTAKGLGAAKVLVASRGGVRMELAEQCGADYVIDTRFEDFGEALLNCFGPDKADVIFDCAGNDTTMNLSIKHARKGSSIILVAVYDGMAKVDLAVLNDHELDLNTSMMYREQDYIIAIDLVKDNKVVLEPLMSKTFPFREYKQAYEYIEANKQATMKVLIDVQEGS